MTQAASQHDHSDVYFTVSFKVANCTQTVKPAYVFILSVTMASKQAQHGLSAARSLFLWTTCWNVLVLPSLTKAPEVSFTWIRCSWCFLGPLTPSALQRCSLIKAAFPRCWLWGIRLSALPGASVCRCFSESLILTLAYQMNGSFSSHSSLEDSAW